MRATERKFKHNIENPHYVAYPYRLFSLFIPKMTQMLQILIDMSQ